jgi:Spy/CpxP family protein refolding chaperone
MKKIIVVILVVMVSAISSSFAQPKRMNMQKHDAMVDKLNLTDAQEKQFNNFHYEHREKAIDWKAQLNKNQLEIQKLMSEKNINSAKLKEITKANSDIKAQMHSSRVDMWLNIYNILNDEQKEQWTKHFSNMGRGDRVCRENLGKFRDGRRQEMRYRDRF